MRSYESSIEQLKGELVSRLGDKIASIVLYGSAARGQYRPMESDIDILIIGQEEDKGIKAQISEIAGNIDLGNSTATSIVYLSKDSFFRYLDWGSPFLECVVEEGIVQYDDGTFRKVRAGLVKASQ